MPDPMDGDVYFSPNLFSRRRRSRETVLPSRWLYADLDTVDPRELSQPLQPHVAWASSPGRYQGLWLVQQLEPDVHQALNRKLTYALGADKGGWDASQVLRLPGMLNHKYDGSPEVKLMWWRGKQVRVTGTADAPANGVGSVLHVVEVTRPIPSWVREKLRQRTPHGDRSRVLYRLEMSLLKDGFSKDEVFSLLRPSAWNKFDDAGLSADIHRAAERVG